jgi:hypothetical protein
MVTRFTWRDTTLFVIVLLVAWALYRGFAIQAKFTREGKEAHDYLCYQKVVGIPSRIKASIDYVNDVEAGIRRPVPGITFRDIQAGIERDEATLRALNRVHC